MIVTGSMHIIGNIVIRIVGINGVFIGMHVVIVIGIVGSIGIIGIGRIGIICIIGIICHY